MKRAAYAAGAAVLLVAVLVALLGPALIDRPAVQAEIQSRLSQALHGQVTWEALDVALFPAPHGELRMLRIDVPEKINASADDVNVYLRLWPLLRGRAEISSLTLKKPGIRVVGVGGDTSSGGDASLDALAAYRAAMEPVVRALQEFAPDTALKLEQATVEIGTHFMLRDLQAAARTDATGVELELATAANLWKRLSVQGRVESRIFPRTPRWCSMGSPSRKISAAALRAKLRTDGKRGRRRFRRQRRHAGAGGEGSLRVPAGKPPELSAELTGVDLAQALAIARRKVAGLDAIESAQGRLSANELALEPSWRLNVELIKSDAAAKLAALPWPLSAHRAKVAITEERARDRPARLPGKLGFLGRRAPDRAQEACKAVGGLRARRSSSSSGFPGCAASWPSRKSLRSRARSR